MSERVDSQRSDDEDGVAERDSDATSKETLKELEEKQENIASNKSDPKPGPSPDGAFDESDEIKGAGAA